MSLSLHNDRSTVGQQRQLSAVDIVILTVTVAATCHVSRVTGGGGVGGAVAESELREADGEEQSQAAGASTGAQPR